MVGANWLQAASLDSQCSFPWVFFLASLKSSWTNMSYFPNIFCDHMQRISVSIYWVSFLYISSCTENNELTTILSHILKHICNNILPQLCTWGPKITIMKVLAIAISDTTAKYHLNIKKQIEAIYLILNGTDYWAYLSRRWCVHFNISCATCSWLVCPKRKREKKRGANDAIYMLLDPFISLKGILFGYKDTSYGRDVHKKGSFWGACKKLNHEYILPTLDLMIAQHVDFKCHLCLPIRKQTLNY